MSRRGPVLVLVGLLAVASPSAGGGTFADAVLGEVDSRVVTASDVGLARALGLFGFVPSAEAIDAREFDRFVRAWLPVAEAERLDLQIPPADLEAAWREAAARAGGPGALEAWLGQHAIELAWARRMVAWDLLRRRFIEVRFRAFVFVTEDQVRAALGPGPQPPEARQRVREALGRAEAERRLGAWLEEALPRASVRRALGSDQRVPLPFPMPGAVGPAVLKSAAQSAHNTGDQPAR